MIYYLARERIFWISGILATVLILFLFLILPTVRDIKTIRKRIADKKEGLDTINALGREYIKAREELLLLEGSAIGRNEKTVLLSALERLFVNSGIDKESVTINSKYKTLSPFLSRKDIDMKFEGVSYEELKRFLLVIKDYSSILHMEGLHIKTRFDNPSLFDGNIQVSVLEKG